MRTLRTPVGSKRVRRAVGADGADPAARVDGTGPDGVGSTQTGGRAAGRVRRWPLSLLALAVPTVIGVVRLTAALRRPFLAGGDAAFIELAVRQALRGRQLLGPYSRFGWNHPGPLLFYLFAPLYRLSGDRSRALFLGSWLVNAGCAVAAVAVVRHRLGEGAARVAAVVVAAFLAAVGFGELINPWNPSLLGLPFLLLMFLGADAATGSTRSLLAGAVVGSYLVQTHLGMLPVVAVTLGWPAAAWATSRRRGALDRRTVVVAVAALTVLWSGPLVDQLTHRPGNARAVAEFFRHPPAGVAHHHSLGDAAAAVTNGATAPFTGQPAGAGDKAPAGRVAAVGAAGLLGAALAIAARKRNRFAAVLGGLGAANLMVAVAATTRVVGDLEPYLFVWAPALLVPPVAAAGLVAGDAARRLPRRAARALLPLSVAAVVAIGAALAADTVRHDTVSFADSPDAAPAARLIEGQVGPDRQRVFRIHVVDGQFEMSSLLLRLVLDGYRFRMSPSYGLYTGDTERAPTPGAPIVVVGTAASPKPPAATPLGIVGPFVFSTVTTLD